MDPEVARITRGPFWKNFSDPTDILSDDEAHYKHLLAGYDQPLSAHFEGPDGSCITMYYAILLHAVQAWVQVEVIDVNVVPTAVTYTVHGNIFASYGHFESDNDSDIKDYCKTTLLKTGDLESVKVERWSKIKLSRSIVDTLGGMMTLLFG
ncbi:uncharacterized protein [Spinacia oleracea]|uniref:Uncharacterized protein isoform X2 n=1 Tax=Spinacia oleracea TaxID=3562 RepID=A0A9R0JBL6_SPIOL|nr:uncharacterized protein LOC110803044 isoform X2 [Spinacia oleracea]